MTTILDRICPDESHLPPSARTWARIITLQGGFRALELRDPNSGQSSDPESKPRHQYLIMRDVLWRRRLPPAPLESERDEAQWAEGPAHWELVEPGSGLPWEWAVAEGVRPYETSPHKIEGTWDLHGNGDCATEGYVMPPAHPFDAWSDVTGVPCPLCEQYLVWYEAGYVPGYRVCMARIDSDSFRVETIRHRWLWIDGVLVLDGTP